MVLREVGESVEVVLGVAWTSIFVSITVIWIRAVKLGVVVLSNLVGVIEVFGGGLLLFTGENFFVCICVLVKVNLIDVTIHEKLGEFPGFGWRSWLSWLLVSVVWLLEWLLTMLQIHVCD